MTGELKGVREDIYQLLPKGGDGHVHRDFIKAWRAVEGRKWDKADLQNFYNMLHSSVANWRELRHRAGVAEDH